VHRENFYENYMVDILSNCIED